MKTKMQFKKAAFAAAALVLALAVVGCGSFASAKKSKGLAGVPDFVNEAYINAKNDVLVGVGAFDLGGDASKMSIGKIGAETRARTDISRQLLSIMRDMVEDHTAVNEFDPDAKTNYLDNTTRAMSENTFSGGHIVTMNTHNGVLWVVMQCSKTEAEKSIQDAVNQASVANAKLAPAKAAALNAHDRMDRFFDKEAAGGPVPVTE